MISWKLDNEERQMDHKMTKKIQKDHCKIPKLITKISHKIAQKSQNQSKQLCPTQNIVASVLVNKFVLSIFLINQLFMF